MHQSPLLNINSTILWLKIVLSAVTLLLLYLRFRTRKPAAVLEKAYSFGARVWIVVAVLFSFAVFHNLGTFRAGTFLHYSEMFHYYLGPKYFEEVGYYDLYNAVIAADTEQGNELAAIPFYTDLRTYQNTQRAAVLGDVERLKSRFSEERWEEFKSDVAFFKRATGMPQNPGLFFLLMDHGYNGSPVSTVILGAITNTFPVEQLRLLALLDVFLVVAMGVLVFRVFGWEMGALFCVYFCVNTLNARDYVSGSLLRYDWLFYLVVAVCLLEKRRYAASAFFVTLSAMLRIFPVLLFLGMAVAIVREVKTARALDKKYVRFVASAAVTALALFLLPAVFLGSGVQPWKDFASKTELHDSGVYVNHLGLRGIVLFEPSHLSLEKFVAAFKADHTNDIVRNWQDIKEREFAQKRPLIVIASLLAFIAVATIIWKRREGDIASLLWPLVLVYTLSYPSQYYYAFLCLFIFLFFARPNSLAALVPLALLLVLNIGILVTDHSGASPIVFYTLVNLYLFVCFCAILGFELYSSFNKHAIDTLATVEPPQAARREPKRRPRRRQRQR